METTEVSQGGKRKWLLAASVILFSTIAFLSIFLYFQLKVSETPCQDQPCNNGGTCIEVGESFKCICPFGYNDSKCKDSSCSTEPCHNNGSCTVNGTSYVCSCQDGYNGTQCEETPCSNQPCLNNGSCEILEASYVCFCPDGYNGTNCEDSSCSSEPCLNNGSCILKGTSYICSCQDGYNGTQCEVTPCSENPCLYGGTCTVSESTYLCSCLQGYSGTSCEGLEQIHEITKEGNYMLRIDLEDFEGETRYALYSNFSIENASSEYTLRISGYSGTAGDAMAYLSQQKTEEMQLVAQQVTKEHGGMDIATIVT